MPQSPQEDLLHALDTTDTFGIYAVHFIPNGGSPFNVMTKRMKQIAIYITKKLGKTEFAPGELEHAFIHIKTYLPDTLLPGQRKELERCLSEFVEGGGSVEVVSYKKIVFIMMAWTTLTIVTGIGGFFAFCGGMQLFFTGAFAQAFLLLIVLIGIIFAHNKITKKYHSYQKDVLPTSFYGNIGGQLLRLFIVPLVLFGVYSLILLILKYSYNHN